ncbi:adhesin [Leclercia tamurae]|uniref:Adhesin n=1 Tax=Leclercia tamurae TaxID=2926467 RepID=A0ABT2RA29_9ENTR|nr:adhesin [Leclercia tamurae]MCU6677673.1 adhesin [Leclercia tamurae]
MAWPLLPEAMAIYSLVGASANAGISYTINGEINPNDVILAYWTGALTANTGLLGTMVVNGGSGATSSYLKSDDPWKGGAISGAASGLGYGIGNKLITPRLDKVFNPNWKNWEWKKLDMGISMPTPPSLLPGISGNATSSLVTEFTNDQA